MKKIFSTQLILPLAILAILTTSGCKKSETEVVPETPQTIFDLKVSPSFDWKTTKIVTIEISGLAVPVTIRNTFYVKSTDGKAIYYNDLLEMDKNYTIRVSLPAYQTQVVASYGAISKTLALTGNTLSFDYTTEQ